jgi:hypothetical protein
MIVNQPRRVAGALALTAALAFAATAPAFAFSSVLAGRRLSRRPRVRDQSAARIAGTNRPCAARRTTRTERGNVVGNRTPSRLRK